MRLEGSCHCGCVRFSLDAPSPMSYLRCFCSICRKTAGSGGFGINLGARVKGMVVEGAEHIRVYDPVGGRTEGRTDGSGRRFCGSCGSPLWNWDGRWSPFINHPRPRKYFNRFTPLIMPVSGKSSIRHLTGSCRLNR